MKYAFLGAGFIANMHADEVKKMPDIDLVGAIDIDENKGIEFAQKYNTKYYATMEDLLKEQTVDIIDICLPTYLHEEYAIKMAGYGINVLTEKPFSLDSASCERINNAFEKSSARIMVAQVLRFWPEYELIKKEIESGKLGEPEILHLHRLCELPSWSTFYNTPSECGGGVLDMHIHDLDFAYYLFGYPTQVYSVGYKNAKGAFNNVVSTLTFENGSSAVVTDCQEMTDGYPFSYGLRYLGTKGCLEYSSVSGETLTGKPVVSITEYLKGEKPEKLELPQGNGYYNEIRYFIDRIKDGEPFGVVSVEDSTNGVRIVEAVKRSIETGEAIKP